MRKPMGVPMGVPMQLQQLLAHRFCGIFGSEGSTWYDCTRYAFTYIQVKVCQNNNYTKDHL